MSGAAPGMPAGGGIAIALSAIRAGRTVLMIDDLGDRTIGVLVTAAGHVTVDAVKFMATVARGPVCVAMRAALLDALEIPPADVPVPGNGRTVFRAPVDLATATAPAASAEGRAETVRALVDIRSAAGDFIRPGQVVPIECDAGAPAWGGIAEAAADLAELAGLTPAGVLCPVRGPDGGFARGFELAGLSRGARLPVVAVSGLIEYRRRYRADRRDTESAPPMPEG
ncbi:3,4-dihydroxy-2-butanone-4-phosphate synthase [Nocardia sp. BMG51109]|uniref:3,4-dihydroxy-2-butanone-4-phosphate synthase n=1 Tax=Nocardia sp. BMG51109 TaxID=1056816 RepID=UPI0004B3DB20|nr:3,4-dihydroxy-2-butanone-4-phosphate synthase [Nocardia sp. BMG51109]